jgi:hypothetical protein
MKANELEITINKPIEEVFAFTLEPKNTPKWVEAVSEETVNTEQIGLGTIYSTEYRELEVTDYDRDKFFELTNHKTSYVCSYTYKKINDDTAQIIYFEYMQDGSNLADPMKQKSFEKLRELLENN